MFERGQNHCQTRILQKKKKKKTLLGYVPVIQNIAMLYYDKSVRCTSQVALKTYIVLIILTGIAMLPTVHMILD